MQRLSGSEIPIEAQDFDRWLDKAAAPLVPTSVIYSERVGIVGTDIARLPESPLTQHVQVDSSHVAFAVNVRALGAVAAALKASPVV
jgi:hypothetical protein